MAFLYLVSRRNTGAALFGNGRFIPTLYKNYSKAKNRLEIEVSNTNCANEGANWYIKKFEISGQTSESKIFAVLSRRLGRGNYEGRPWLVSVFTTKEQAEEYVKTNSPQSLLGRFFAEYELSIEILRAE
jgi:hypothetical protein